MYPDQFGTTARPVAGVVDQGLRAHMQKVYNRMTLGVFITAIVSYVVSSTPVLLQIFLGGPQAYVIMFAPLALLWFGFRPTMSSGALKLSFIGISVLYGLSFATIFLAFTGESIARAFFIAMIMFGGLSIFGYTTRKNLDALGTFAIMGVFGVLGLSLVAFGLSMFTSMELASLSNVIAAVGIIAFAGITAWQTQATKESYDHAAGEESNSKAAWFSALNLYISFIAMFQYLLHFIGNRE